MKVETLAIPEVKLITPKRFGDERGYFTETWNERAFSEAGLDFAFVQDNQAGSAAVGTLRGMHFQKPPHAQGKMVRVLRGAIFDVALDIRTGSPTYGRHVAVTLRAETGGQFWVPPGFAHGYMTLEPDTEVFYKVTDFYAPDDEGGILWSDPALGIAWPDVGSEPVINARDRAWPGLHDLPEVFRYEP